MRLESITLRSYRVHRELTVLFDAACTLIGGPNESGKSTLIEATQRALFLRAKTGGEVQKSMVSRRFGGHPEVEVGFTARGRRWQVVKRFSGPSGTVTLNEVGGQSWSGDEAEEKLGELLGTEIVGGHAARRIGEVWAHLWIWQGCAGEDPTDHANTHCADLLARLQHEGGAAAVRSACDARVADAIARRHSALFKDNGDARSGSELAQAQAAEAEARAAHAVAQQSLDRVEAAVAEFGAAEGAIRAAEQARAQLQPQLDEIEGKLARVAALRSEEKIHAPAALAAAEKYDAFAAADARIRRLRVESEEASATLAPLDAETVRFSTEEAARRKADATAEAAWTQVSEALRAARLRSELATAHEQRIEKAAACGQLAARLAQVRLLRGELTARQTALAQFPALTPPKMRALHGLDGECAQAKAALAAMAAGVEVLASDQPVRLGGESLDVGEAKILTEEAILEIGPGIRVRIRPGGGTSLAAARERVRETGEKLRGELDRFGLASLDAAAHALAQREQIEAEITTTTARLEALGTETIEADFAALENARASAEADVQRRAGLVKDLPAPATIEEARELVTQCAQQLREAEERESSARAERKAAAEQWRHATERLEMHRESFQKKKQAVADVAAQLRLLVETHGADKVRAARFVELSTARTEAQAQLDAARRALAELQPEQLTRDRERLARSLAQHAAAQREAEEKRATARGELQRDGAIDPQAELALAEERLRSATARREREQRRGEAIALLHTLFCEEQKALAEQFTRPLAAKISGYLECLFGPGARAEVTLEASTFQGLRLIRPTHGEGAFEFGHLSGGTREQFAAAVRLALAEVLAETHDGSLPIVFDDAFTYSDPDRVQVLQRMLDLAATRGLQVIVLSCNPADYAALGAKQIASIQGQERWPRSLSGD
jgi:hypothetical protein